LEDLVKPVNLLKKEGLVFTIIDQPLFVKRLTKEVQMIKLECKKCATGIFNVEKINALGNLPKRWTCHICGMLYILKLDENDTPAVFYKKTKKHSWKKLEIRGL